MPWSLLDESDAMGLTYTTKRAAMDAMVEEINATGGLGDSGRPVELVYCVTQFDRTSRSSALATPSPTTRSWRWSA